MDSEHKFNYHIMFLLQKKIRTLFWIHPRNFQVKRLNLMILDGVLLILLPFVVLFLIMRVFSRFPKQENLELELKVWPFFLFKLKIKLCRR